MEYSIIGKMYETAPTFDDEGNILTDGVLAEGWHVNARGEVPDTWEQYEIDAPVTPLRVYQEGGTRFFVFPDEAAFRAVEPSEE